MKNAAPAWAALKVALYSCQFRGPLHACFNFAGRVLRGNTVGNQKFRDFPLYEAIKAIPNGEEVQEGYIEAWCALAEALFIADSVSQ